PEPHPGHHRTTDGRVRALLDYYRACVHREAVLDHLIELGGADTPSASSGHHCLPAGTETLFSGAGEDLLVPPEANGVLRAARREGRPLRYGYPVVLLAPDPAADAADEGPGDVIDSRWRAAPLLVTDVEVVPDTEEPRVRAVSEPDVNPALLRRAGITDPEELAALRAVLRQGASEGDRPHDGVVLDLEAKVRTLLTRLDIDRVDDIVPRAIRGTLPHLYPRAGAHNVAVLFRSGPAEHAAPNDERPGTITGLLADLDPGHRDGPRPGQADGTALEALLEGEGGAGSPHTAPPGRPARGSEATREEAVLPVADGRLTEAQYAILRSAMRERLTAVAAPPGTGLADLIDAAVRTAVVADQSVLVASAEEPLLDRIVRRAGEAPGHLVLRTGHPDHRSREIRTLERLVEQPTSPPDLTPHNGSLRDDWSRVDSAWKSIDAIAHNGHSLARLAEERGEMIGHGWDPDALFTPEHGDPGYWLRRAERARGGGFVALAHRSAIRRELGVEPTPENLQRLCRVARIELDWRTALDRRRRTPMLAGLLADLEAAQACHRLSGDSCLRGVVSRRAGRGRQALLNRLETLNWHHTTGWPGFAHLLTVVPAWAVGVRAARALPPQAGLFDLVVVAGAEHCRMAEVLPLLYRAKRALVIGDPAQPAPPTLLEPAEEQRLRGAAGPTWLDRRPELGYAGYSAYEACAAATSASRNQHHWLDEHDRSHPTIAALASRHCYGGRIAVTTEPANLPTPVRTAPEDRATNGHHPAPPSRGADRGGRAVEWRHFSGDCEPVPGASGINREEAYRVAVVLQELDGALPEDAVIGVIAPFQPQWALLRRLVRRQGFGRQIRVGGVEEFRGEENGAVDVMVVSPTVATDAPARLVDRAVRSQAWATALTRTVSRLIVVGDRSFWSGTDSPLRDLCPFADTVEEESTALRNLRSALQARGAPVTQRPSFHGHQADLCVDTGRGPVLVLLDHARSGLELRRLLAHGELLTRLSGHPAVCVPAWRCLHDPPSVVNEILHGGD
ncbi:DEAD/DEAH box helicase, partial [Nocardiopsis gilva]